MVLSFGSVCDCFKDIVWRKYRLVPVDYVLSIMYFWSGTSKIIKIWRCSLVLRGFSIICRNWISWVVVWEFDSISLKLGRNWNYNTVSLQVLGRCFAFLALRNHLVAQQNHVLRFKICCEKWSAGVLWATNFGFVARFSIKLTPSHATNLYMSRGKLRIVFILQTTWYSLYSSKNYSFI